MTSQKSDCHSIPLRGKAAQNRAADRARALPGVEISPPALVVRQICTIFVFQTVSRPREQCIVLYEYTYVSCRVNGGPPARRFVLVRLQREEYVPASACMWLAMTPLPLSHSQRCLSGVVGFDKPFICDAAEGRPACPGGAV